MAEPVLLSSKLGNWPIELANFSIVISKLQCHTIICKPISLQVELPKKLDLSVAIATATVSSHLDVIEHAQHNMTGLGKLLDRNKILFVATM